MWLVPPIWRGRTVAVLASGPSMSREIANAVRAAGVPTIVVNRTYELAPWADLLVANDLHFWQQTPEALKFAGWKLCLQDHPFVDVLTLALDDMREAREGGNSGYTAVWIANRAQAARIVLCGFDFHGAHWHAEHVTPLRNAPPEAYSQWAANMEKFARTAQATIYNATPDSALTCFPVKSLAECLSMEIAK